MYHNIGDWLSISGSLGEIKLSARRENPAKRRGDALAAGKALLIAGGAEAVTLAALAARLECTHANVLYHFGTIGKFREELSIYVAEFICSEVQSGIVVARNAERPARAIVDLVFDVFARHGGMHLTHPLMRAGGNQDALAPVIHAVHDLVVNVCNIGVDTSRAITRALVLQALGDAHVGERLGRVLFLPNNEPRIAAEGWLARLTERHGNQAAIVNDASA